MIVSQVCVLICSRPIHVLHVNDHLVYLLGHLRKEKQCKHEVRNSWVYVLLY